MSDKHCIIRVNKYLYDKNNELTSAFLGVVEENMGIESAETLCNRYNALALEQNSNYYYVIIAQDLRKCFT